VRFLALMESVKNCGTQCASLLLRDRGYKIAAARPPQDAAGFGGQSPEGRPVQLRRALDRSGRITGMVGVRIKGHSNRGCGFCPVSGCGCKEKHLTPKCAKKGRKERGETILAAKLRHYPRRP
jgi:hypothetical protein